MAEEREYKTRFNRRNQDDGIGKRLKSVASSCNSVQFVQDSNDCTDCHPEINTQITRTAALAEKKANRVEERYQELNQDEIAHLITETHQRLNHARL